MKILEKIKGHLLSTYDTVENGHPRYIWGDVSDASKDLNLDFDQKKQLFLELIEYYMNRGLLRFKNYFIEIIPKSKTDETPELPGDDPFKYGWERRNVKWSKADDEFPQTEEVIEYLTRTFPDLSTFEESGDGLNFFYHICPPAQWFWTDSEDPNDKGKWYDCD